MWVGIGPGVESRWGGGDFPQTVRTCFKALPASYTLSIKYFVGVKRLERGVDHLIVSSAVVKGRVKLNF